MKLSSARACTVGVGQRSIRGAIALLLAAFAVTFAPTHPVVAVVAGVLAVGVTVMAITGFCPAAWFSLRRHHRAAEASHGYRDATAVVQLTESIQVKGERS